MADNVTGIVLDIPNDVLNNIKNADKAIKDLEQTSKKAAQNIKSDFDTTMVSGVEAFIKKVQEAQKTLDNLKMPKIDATGLSSAIQSLSQAMATIDKSATAGSNRLTLIANAMVALQTANPDPQLFQNIADGITKIGNTSQQTIQNVSELAKAMAQLARDIRIVQQAQQAQDAKTATAAQYNKLYKEQAQLMRDIQTLQEKKSPTAQEVDLLDKMRKRYDEITQQIDKLNQKNQTAASNLARAQGQMKLGLAANVSSPMGAIDYAKNAKSLNELMAAYKNLKAVMATVDPKSSAWQQMNAVLGQTKKRIDEIEKEMGEFKNQASQVGDVAGQLKRTLAAAFSISAITGYINKLIETRAQFELQQTALRAILQDKQKADEVFQQVQQMALQSPFSIMQMTTFTKQLAAYRIESEKLVGTTKMLADVSAGLGVDMGRLILAYGQVKAANYLRATEVRQFTEAGLNIAGELATYFSELQGKMISVGDVMEMITKRMVRFEDVEEVFKRVTSAGGLFYDMQKKQSETLWGQLQRIKDAMSIMFNEIGKSNQGAISTMLTLIRSLINHWRMLAPIITTVGGAMATVLAVQGIKAFITSLRTMGATIATLVLKWRGVESAAAAAAIAERGAAMATGIGLAVTAVTMLAGALYGAYQEAHKLDEEFDRISEESSKDMWDLIFKFQEGADAVRDTTKSYEERQKALEDLQNTFRGILPDQDLEYNNIIRITDGYKSATEAIKAYSAEKAKQTAQEAIETEKQTMYGGLIKDAKKMTGTLKGTFESLRGASDAAVKGMIGNVMLQIQQETEQGMIKSAEQGYNRFMEILRQRFGEPKPTLWQTLKPGLETDAKELFGLNAGSSFMTDTFGEYLTFMLDKQKEYAEQYQVVSEGMTQQDIDSFKNYKKNYELRAKALEDFQAKLLAYQEARQNGDIDAQGNATNEAGQGRIADLESATGKLNHFLTVTGEAAISWKDLKTNTDYETDALVYFDEVQKRVLGSFLQNIINAGENRTIVNWAEETNKSLRAAGFQEMQLDIANTAKKWGLLSGVSSAVMNKIKIDAKTTYSSAAKDAKALSDEAQQNIKKINQTATSLIDMGLAANKAQAMAMAEKQWGTTIQEEKNTKKWAKKLAKLWGDIDKSSSKQKDIWTPRLNLMQKVNKEYEKLLKYYSKEEAMARIRTSYGDAVAEAFKGTQWADISKWGTFDAQATIDRLKNLAEKAGKDAKKKILEAAGTLQAEIDIKIEEKNIQDAKDKIQELFDNYELTKTLGGLGLNIDLTYLVGGKPVKLEDLRKQLEAELSTVKTTGGEEDTVKAYEDALRKVTDLENKAQLERIKSYSKYLAASYSDAAKLQLDYFAKLTKMRESFAKSQADLEKKLASPDTSPEEKLGIQRQLDNLPNQAKRAAQGMREEMEKELSKLNMDALFKSTLFSEMFQDLGNLSGKVLDQMLEKIKKIQEGSNNLSLSQVRQLSQAAEKITNAKIDTASFKEAASYITKAYKLVREGISPEKANTGLADASAQLDVLNQQIEDYNFIIGIKEKGYKIDGQNLVVAGERVSLTDQQRQLLSKSNQALNTQLAELLQSKGAAEELVAKFREYVQTFNKGQKATQRMNTLLQKLGEAGKAGIDAIVSGVEMFGGSVDDSTQMWLDFAGQIIDSCISLGIMFVALGIQINSALGIIGLIATALTVVAGLFKAILGASDARKEKQIKKLKDRVDELKNAYEDLGEAIDNAYKFSDYKLGYQQSLANIKQQEAAYREMIRLEESKKKTDQDKIKDYRDALRDLEKARKQLQDDMYEDWGSVGESGIRTEAENFVSAWLDAYKEVGDGLDALNEHWDDFLKNLVLKQAASAVVGARIKKYIEQLNKAIENGEGGLSLAQTFAQIGQNLKSELGAWNEDLKAFFDAVGIKGGQGELLLSDLQKGIQNITEPQAAAIEAYLNSMRFAVFEQNNILTNMLAAIQAQYGSNDNSSMLQEVRAIRSLVSSIDDKLSRVVVSRSSQNTNYIVKVG